MRLLPSLAKKSHLKFAWKELAVGLENEGARICLDQDLACHCKGGLRPPAQYQSSVLCDISWFKRGRPSAARLSEMIAVIKERFRICSFCKRSTATLLREHIWRCCIKNGNSCYTSIYIYIYTNISIVFTIYEKIKKITQNAPGTTFGLLPSIWRWCYWSECA